MNSLKRSASLLLALVFLFGCIPSAVFSAGSVIAGGNTINVGYYDGMTVAELVKYINSGAGLPEDTPIDSWQWYARGNADYEYGRYLVDVMYENDIISINKENVNFLRALEVYEDYLDGKITEEELKNNYSDVDFVFNSINIDHEALKVQIEDALDKTERDFRKQRKYVSLYGETVTVTGKQIVLDRQNDPHCMYEAKIILAAGVEIEEQLCCPTTLEVNGSEAYLGIIEGIKSGEDIVVRNGDKVYNINIYGINRSKLVLKGAEDGIYPISFNPAAGETELDILEKIYAEVLDFEQSIFCDDFDKNDRSGFTVSFYDNKTGWYPFDKNESGRLVCGNVYEVEMVFDGYTTAKAEFKIAVYDPRTIPTIGVYNGNTLIIQNTETEIIKEEIFKNLIDKSDLPKDVQYTDFEYYYFVGDLSRIFDRQAIADATDEIIEQYRDSFYEKIWEASHEKIESTVIGQKLTKEEIKERYFTREYLEKKLEINDWIPLDGGYYPITVDFEGDEIELFQVKLPDIVAGNSYQIKVEYKGNSEYAPSYAESTEFVLQVLRLIPEIDVEDGVYEAGTAIDGFVSTSLDVDYFLISAKIDPVYLETTQMFVQFPGAINGLLRVKTNDGTIIDGSEELQLYLATEDLRVRDWIEILARLDENLAEEEEREEKQSLARRYVAKVEKMLSQIPGGGIDAPVDYGGMPIGDEGVFLVFGMVSDINSTTYFDDGVCIFVEDLERDYFIEYDNEIYDDYPLYEDEWFDFTAHVYSNEGELYEDAPEAFNCYIGVDYSNDKTSYFSSEPPYAKGEYLQISISDVANPTFRYFDIGVMKTFIESPGDEFEYDGKRHGAPVIYDIEGNILPLTENDDVLYMNLLTGELNEKAPTKVGMYAATVMYNGDENHKSAFGTYQFSIIPKEINVTLGDYTMVYGDEFPEYKIQCDMPELLDVLTFTVVPGASYHGNVGTYELVLSVGSVPEGYVVNKTFGTLTVVERDVTIQMADREEVYGTDFELDDPKYYISLEGSVVEGDKLGLTFAEDTYKNVGEYEYLPTGYTNKNYNLTFVGRNENGGTLTIVPRTLELTIKSEIIYEGDALPEFVTVEKCPDDLKLHIAPAYYDGKIGEYTLIGTNDNPNYKVHIIDGMLMVKARPAKEIVLSTPDYEIVYGDKLPDFEVITKVLVGEVLKDIEIKDVNFKVEIEADYNGDVGTYALNIIPGPYDGDKYNFIEILPGTLTVTKKPLTISIQDYETVYGQEFDPYAAYVFQCDDPEIDLEKILKYKKIGAEYFDGNAGSYLLIGKATADNYEITVESATLTVNPKPIKVIPTAGQGKYPGEADGFITYKAEGLVGEDVLEGQLSREEGEEMGLYEILLGTLNNPNYTIEVLKEYYSIRSKEYRKIEIRKLPDNLVYLQGSKFNPEGMEVVAIDHEGNEITLEYEKDYKVLGFDSDAEDGKQHNLTLTVFFEGHTACFDICVMPSKVSLVKVDALPDKLIYVEGQEFDPTGLTFVVFYDNGAYKYLDTKYINFTGFDMSVIGEQTVKAEFGGVYDTFKITVIEKTVCGVEVDTTEAKTEYIEGQKFTTEGLKVYAVYTNGTRVELGENEYDISGFNTSKVGKQTVRVEYAKSFKTTYIIEVKEKHASEIETLYDGNELQVVVGCTFDPAQLTVIATYNDGDVATIKFGDYKIYGFNNSEIGIYSAFVEYDGVVVPVLVRVVASSIVNIEIVDKPVKDVYTLGEELDITGLTIKTNSNNGTSEMVIGFAVRGFDSEKLGVQYLEISYLGFKTKFKVTVVPPSFEGIKVTKLPDVTKFIEQTRVDLTGLVVSAVCDEEYVIPTEDLIISEADNTVVGVQSITVEYAHKTCEFEIEILEKSVVSIEVVNKGVYIVYTQDGILTLTGRSLRVMYDNGTEETIALEEGMFGEFDKTVLGKQTVSVSYGGKSTECFVWVVEKEIKGIMIAREPARLTYPEGVELDVSDMEILVMYTDDTSIYVTPDECDITGFDKNTIGEQTITVNYANHKAELKAEVTPKQLYMLNIETLPYKTEFVYSYDLDLTGMKVVCYYDNGESFEVSLEELSISGYSPYTYGDQTITLEYRGLSAIFGVKVVELAPIGIAIDTQNAITEYYLGNKLDTKGLELYIIYNNGDMEYISAEDCTFSGFSSEAEGTYTVWVKWEKDGVLLENSYEVSVGNEDIVDIVLNLGTMDTTTIEGVPHDFEKLIVTARYRNGQYRELAYGAYTVEDYSFEKYGTYNAKVVFGEYTSKTTIELIVLPKVVGIQITKKPSKLSYVKGEELDLTGFELSEVYSDGSLVVIPVGEFEAEALLHSTGTATVNVTALCFETSFEVEVYGYGILDILEGAADKYYSESGFIVVDDLGNVTTLGELKAALKGGAYICAKDGEIVLGDETLLATGMKLYFEADGVVYAEYTVIVKGDVDGSGVLDITDATKIFHSLTGNVVLDEAELIAADLVKESSVTDVNITDAVLAFHSVKV